MSDSPEPQTTEEADAAFEDVLEDVEVEATETEVTEEVTEASPEEDAQLPTRDEQGRFAKAEGSEETAEPPETTETPAEPEAEVEAPTFRYQAEGREFEIPGSAQGEQGVFLPTDALPDVTRMFREAQAFRGSYQQTLSRKDREHHQVAARAEAAEASLQTLQDKLEELVTNDGAFEQFVLDQRANWQVLKAQADAAGKDRLLQQERSERETWELEKHDQEMRPVMYRRLDEGVRHYGNQLGLPEKVLKATYGRMAGNLDKYFPRAEQDDPQHNMKKGQRYDLDQRAVQGELAWIKDAIGTVPIEEPKKAPQPGKKPPPTVPAKKGPTPPGKKKPDFSKADDPTAAVDEWFENM